MLPSRDAARRSFCIRTSKFSLLEITQIVNQQTLGLHLRRWFGFQRAIL
jgi:hypothetical protein